MSAWTQLTEPGPALLILILVLTPQLEAAPFENVDQSSEIEYYPVADATGCYYNFEHYDEGDRIITNEPCLNCTCHNRMLMCYLRVCPYTKAIGQDCKVEKKPDQCCPVITCPEVPVQLVPHASTTPSTHVGHPSEYGCSIDNLFYADGAKVPSNPNNPCEVCYCIRNKTACIIQECTLTGEVVEGCRPVYVDGVCCPVRYDCDHPELEGTPRPLLTTTTTTLAPTTAPTDCIFNNEVYADGALVKKDIPCEQCYCMRGDIVCAVQECGPTPLDKVNCTALPPKEGQCCPDTYECDHISEEDLTTLSSVYEVPTTVPTNIEGAETLGGESPATETEEQVSEATASIDSQTKSEESHVTESATIETITSKITETVDAVTSKVTEIVEAITSTITGSERESTPEPEIPTEQVKQEQESATIPEQLTVTEQITEKTVEQQPVTISEITPQVEVLTEETKLEAESSTTPEQLVTDKIDQLTEKTVNEQQPVTATAELETITEEIKQATESSTISEQSLVTDKAEQATQKIVEQQPATAGEVVDIPNILIEELGSVTVPEQATISDKTDQVTEKTVDEQQPITLIDTEEYTEQATEAITESSVHEIRLPESDDQKLVTVSESNIPVTTESLIQETEKVPPQEQETITDVLEPVAHDDHEESEQEELPHEGENELIEGSGEPEAQEPSITETTESQIVDEHIPSIDQGEIEKQPPTTEQPEEETTSLLTETQQHGENEVVDIKQETSEAPTATTLESKTEQGHPGPLDQAEAQVTQQPELETSAGVVKETDESLQTTEESSPVESESHGTDAVPTELIVTEQTGTASEDSVTTASEETRGTEKPTVHITEEPITEEPVVLQHCTKEGCYPVSSVTETVVKETEQPLKPEKPIEQTETESSIVPEIEATVSEQETHTDATEKPQEGLIKQETETKSPMEEVTGTENLVTLETIKPTISEEEHKTVKPQEESATTIPSVQEPDIIKAPPPEEKEHKEEEQTEKTSVTEEIPLKETQEQEKPEDEHITTEKQEELQFVTEIPTKESEKPQSMDHVSETVSSAAPSKPELETQEPEIHKETETTEKGIYTELPQHETDQPSVTKSEETATKIPETENEISEGVTEIATSASVIPGTSPVCDDDHGCAPEQGEDSEIPGIVEECTKESCIPHGVVHEAEGSTEINIPESSEDKLPEKPLCDNEQGCISHPGKEDEIVTEINQISEGPISVSCTSDVGCVPKLPEKEGEEKLPSEAAVTEAGEIQKTSEIGVTEITTAVSHETQHPEQGLEQPTVSEAIPTPPKETEHTEESEQEPVSEQEEIAEGTEAPKTPIKEKPEQGTEETVISEGTTEKQTIESTSLEGQPATSTEETEIVATSQEELGLENEVRPESTPNPEHTEYENTEFPQKISKETENPSTSPTVVEVSEEGSTESSIVPEGTQTPSYVALDVTQLPESQKPEHGVENEIIPEGTESPESTQPSKQFESGSTLAPEGTLPEGTETIDIGTTQVPEVIVPEDTKYPQYTPEGTIVPEEVSPPETISSGEIPESSEASKDESNVTPPSASFAEESTQATESAPETEVTELPKEGTTTGVQITEPSTQEQVPLEGSVQNIPLIPVTIAPEDTEKTITESFITPEQPISETTLTPKETETESTEISEISSETTNAPQQVISETTHSLEEHISADNQAPEKETEEPEKIFSEKFEDTTVPIQVLAESTEAPEKVFTQTPEEFSSESSHEPELTSESITLPAEQVSGEAESAEGTPEQIIPEGTLAPEQAVPESTQLPVQVISEHIPESDTKAPEQVVPEITYTPERTDIVPQGTETPEHITEASEKSTFEEAPTPEPVGTEANEVTQGPEEDITESATEAIPTKTEEEHGIPGEGSCLVDGRTYKNNSNVPPINQCQTLCKCISSILQCESVSCSPPPSNLQDCMPIFHSPDSCCPTYTCSVPGVTNMESDSHVVETTTVNQEEERPVATTGIPVISSEQVSTVITEKVLTASEEATTKQAGEETYVTVKSEPSTSTPQEQTLETGSVPELPPLPISEEEPAGTTTSEDLTTQKTVKPEILPEIEISTAVYATEAGTKEPLISESQTVTPSSEGSTEIKEEEQYPEQDEIENEVTDKPITPEHCGVAGCVPVFVTSEQDKTETEIPEKPLSPEYSAGETTEKEIEHEEGEDKVTQQSEEKDEEPVTATEVGELGATGEPITPAHIVPTEQPSEEGKLSEVTPPTVTEQSEGELLESTKISESERVTTETVITGEKDSDFITESIEQKPDEDDEGAIGSETPIGETRQPEFNTEKTSEETSVTEKAAEPVTEVIAEEASKTPEEVAAMPEIEEVATSPSVLPEYNTEPVLTEVKTEEGEQSIPTTEGQLVGVNTEQSPVYNELENELPAKPEIVTEIQETEIKPDIEINRTEQTIEEQSTERQTEIPSLGEVTSLVTNAQTTESQQILETTSLPLEHVTESKESVFHKPESASHVTEKISEEIPTATEIIPENPSTQTPIEEEVKTDIVPPKESIPKEETEITTLSPIEQGTTKSAESEEGKPTLPEITTVSVDEGTKVNIIEHGEEFIEKDTTAPVSQGETTEINITDLGEKESEKGSTVSVEENGFTEINLIEPERIQPEKTTTVSVEQGEITEASPTEPGEKETGEDKISVEHGEVTEVSSTEPEEKQPETGTIVSVEKEEVPEINLVTPGEKETEKSTTVSVEQGETTEINLIESEKTPEESTIVSVEQGEVTEVNTIEPGRKETEKDTTISVDQGEATEASVTEAVEKQTEKESIGSPVTEGLLTPEKEQETTEIEKEQNVTQAGDVEFPTHAPINKEVGEEFTLVTETGIKEGFTPSITTETPQPETSTGETLITKPTVETPKPEEVSTSALYTSGPSEEVSTKKSVQGELSTSAPVTSIPSVETSTSASTHAPALIPGEQVPELPDYHSSDDYEEEDQGPLGPGTCRYGGKVYVSAQQIPRDDPCDFCFCFRSDIICLQQSCPPPIPRCHEEPIRGFCCPRYECPVGMAMAVNVTTSTTTTTTTLPPHFLSHAYKGRVKRTGCQIKGKAYQVGEDIKSASGPCLHCICGGDGEMKCDPKACSPEPMLRQMIAAAASRRRR